MTNEQRRFRIEKIDSYEQQISQEKKIAAKKTFLFGLAAAGMACAFSGVMISSNIEATESLVNLCIGLLNAGYSAYNLKGLIEAINRKTMLQGKVEDVNFELNMPENNESRGIKR